MSTNSSDNRFHDSLQYEEFVRQSYEVLIGHRIGKVYSKKVYVGKRTGHQHEIDVSIELEIADLLILILVECKHYRSKVDISDVLEFAQRIDDIGAHKGVMVTTIGYQEGALKVARAHRIALVSTIPYWRMIYQGAGPSVSKHPPDDAAESHVRDDKNQGIPMTVINYGMLTYLKLKRESLDSFESIGFSTAWRGIIVSLRDEVIGDSIKKGILKLELYCSRCESILREFHYSKCINCLTELESSEFTDSIWYTCNCGKVTHRSNLNEWQAKCECGKTFNYTTLSKMRQWTINYLIKKSLSKR